MTMTYIIVTFFYFVFLQIKEACEKAELLTLTGKPRVVKKAAVVEKAKVEEVS